MNLDLIEIQKIMRWIPSGYDLCLCSGMNCPHRYHCFRFLAEAGGKQDYFGSPPILPSGFCDSFMDARPLFMRSIQPHIISQLASEISQDAHTRDELNWFLAEIQNKIENLREGKLNPLNQERIQLTAYFLSQNLYGLDDLHWLLAEQLLLEKVMAHRISELKKTLGLA